MPPSQVRRAGQAKSLTRIPEVRTMTLFFRHLSRREEPTINVLATDQMGYLSSPSPPDRLHHDLLLLSLG